MFKESYSLRSKRFRGVQARGSGEKNYREKKEGGGGGEGRKRLQTDPWILKTTHFAFHA